MADLFKGSDFLYIGLGAGFLYLLVSSAKPLAGAISSLSGVVTSASNVVTPVLDTAAQATKAITGQGTPVSTGNFIGGIWKSIQMTFPPTSAYHSLTGEWL